MKELIEKRTKYAKHYDLGGGKRQAVITQHPQHFFNNGWQDINTNWLLESGFGQKVQQAEHHLRLYNDGKERLRFGFGNGVYVDYELPGALNVFTGEASKSGAWENTDLKYTVTPEGIKGEIILKDAGHPAEFSFPLRTVNCTPIVEGNALLFVSGVQVVGRIPAPYMVDAEGEIGPVALSYDGGKVTFTPDAEWLEGAAYPVTIDPTTTIQPDQTAGKDTALTTYSPDSNYGTNQYIYAGARSNLTSRLLIQFDLSSIPTGASISSTDLSLYCNNVEAASGKSLSAHKITTAWDESTATWNNQPSYDGTAIDTISVADVSAWYAWDITSLASGWHGGTITNYGAIIKAVNEADTASYKRFYSSDYTTDTSLRPKLVVEYTAPVNVTIDAVTASAIANAVIPSIAAQQNTSVSATTATATANAVISSITAQKNSYITGVTATATASAVISSVSAQQNITISAETATATATAIEALISAGISVEIEAVTATATAVMPEASITAVMNVIIEAETATATADMPTATILTPHDATIEAVTATATADMPISTITAQQNISITAAVAEAVAAALEPVITAQQNASVSAAVAQATAAAITPTVTAQMNAFINAAAAAAEASMPVPTITAQMNVTIQAVTAEATASMPIPGVYTPLGTIIVTITAKERRPSIEIIERTPSITVIERRPAVEVLL